MAERPEFGRYARHRKLNEFRAVRPKILGHYRFLSRCGVTGTFEVGIEMAVAAADFNMRSGC